MPIDENEELNVEQTETEDTPTSLGEDLVEGGTVVTQEEELDEAAVAQALHEKKYGTPSEKFESLSRKTRPSLTPAVNPEGTAPLLDITEDGIFTSDEQMEAHFPKVKAILKSSRKANALTAEELAELGAYALSKALFTHDDINTRKGVLDNQIHKGELTFGPKMISAPVPAGQELDLTDIANLGITISGGGVVNFPLINSGFRIKLEPFGVLGEIALEESITHRIGEVGRSTIGGGILALDAVIIDVAIDKILDKVIGHNVKGVTVNDKDTLRKLISHKDIRPIMNVMNYICNLDGYDYDVACPKCHHINRMTLNCVRAMHYDHGKLNAAQIEQLLTPIKTELDIKDIRKYQESFAGHAMTKEYKVGDAEFKLHLRTGSIENKTNSYRTLFNMLEEHARELVGADGVITPEAIDSKSQELLQRMWHLHYLPLVSSIDVKRKGVTSTASKPRAILELLKLLSVTDTTGDIAQILTDFAYDNTVTFATHTPTCTSCGHVNDEMRTYNPVIDFFIRRMSQTISTSIIQEVMMRS